MSWPSLESIAEQLWMRMADASLRAIILTALAGLLVVCLRKRAAAQHVVWSVVAAGMVLLPLLRPMIPTARLPIAEPQMLRAVRAEPQPQLAATPGSPLLASANAPYEAAGARPSWPVYIVIVYITGVLLFGIRLSLGLLLSGGLLRRARPLREDLWRFHTLIADAGVEVQIQESERVRVPVTLGLTTMRVILPEEWRAWPDEKVTVVLAHELTHARRRDPLLALVAAVNKCIFWFHPLAWWLERRLALLAERVADDVAVAVAQNAESYARMVLEVASRMKGQNRRIVLHGAGLNGALLAERIRRVMDPRTQKCITRLGNTAHVALLTCAGLLLWIAAAVDFHNTAQAQTTASGQVVSQQSVGVSEKVAPENLIIASPPVYPPLAKATRVQGVVLLDVRIGSDGRVTGVDVIRGHVMLVQAAIDAVRNYVYKPFFFNGNPVSIRTTVHVPFVLDAGVDPDIEMQLNATSQPGTINVPPPPPPPPPPPEAGASSMVGSPQAMQVSKEIAQGNLIEPAKPVYPPLAKAARVQGVVTLNARIGSGGRVIGVNVISGHPLLTQAAIEAVKQYLYKPFKINGKDIEVVTTVEVQFEPDPK